MNEPDITICFHSPGRSPRLAPRVTPKLPCYAYSPWSRFPVIGPALTVLIAIVSALALVSNANAFNDINAELQIAAREQRLAKVEAQRVAREQAARQATLVAAANDRQAAVPARALPVVNRNNEEKKGRAQ
ncbi:hypothetical protein ACQ86G_15925 [Roseateles chitinivorans]|uniref:hypothetical protein n=1 Tax=Roseateles chitinivorans TaxID=2917965 RepID=UPI003D679266